ncbi:30S ribosomal protein S14 [Trueperella pyogenes]|uniref:30S ribosomal protein S14 n=1 Tax=Trueperella pyogenes TaxID=1661 RepID=UPI00043ACECA|nr:30S ribosomal protein S14 [Trueperella pyogenes]AHU89628.1 30S ribosomal protein S14 [Trueperella pyogenes]OQD37267.1 30S ribosomal protein S14 [Trueperella pyogenes]
MAKKSKIARDAQRRAVVAKYADKRAWAKKMSVSPHATDAERDEAMWVLHSLPRNASPTRLRNRDVTDGRPRGYLRKFGLSRVEFRKRALEGELPGVHKASW